MIKKGDLIKLKPEWMDAGDENIEFRANGDEYDGRVEIVALVGLALNPTQIVKVSWIEGN